MGCGKSWAYDKEVAEEERKYQDLSLVIMNEFTSGDIRKDIAILIRMVDNQPQTRGTYRVIDRIKEKYQL